MLLNVDLSVVFGCVEDTVNVKEDYRTKNSRSPSSFQLDGLVVTKHFYQLTTFVLRLMMLTKIVIALSFSVDTLIFVDKYINTINYLEAIFKYQRK